MTEELFSFMMRGQQINRLFCIENRGSTLLFARSIAETRAIPSEIYSSMSDPRKVTVWAAALQDHYFGQKESTTMSKTTSKQREKWERESKRRQNLMHIRLPKIVTNSRTPTNCNMTPSTLKTNAPPQHTLHSSRVNPVKLQPDIVLDKPPKITLAQKIGIIESPPKLLTKNQWNEVKEKAKSTHGTYRTDCAICCEPFAALSQVILSCGHSFHQACIKSYEKHTHSKRCPLCRTTGYETLVTSDAASVYYNDAAVKIQSVWRMWQCRRLYLKHRREHIPNHPLLKRRYHMEKLSSLNQSLSRQIQNDNCEIEQVFRDMEQSLKISRDTFEKFSAFYTEPQDWDEVVEKIYNRKENPLEEPCSICLCDLTPKTEKGEIAVAADAHSVRALSKRKVAMLSCGHLFHWKCITNMEKFNSGCAAHVCPICRSKYTRAAFPCSPFEHDDLI
ncbi:hypothetical protein BDR26DRAFT_323030 [Obelidium mucronatum]|nr:hypothetical protein BDR26DRAFT_323030 [Obelidium mucronatum]